MNAENHRLWICLEVRIQNSHYTVIDILPRLTYNVKIDKFSTKFKRFPANATPSIISKCQFSNEFFSNLAEN